MHEAVFSHEASLRFHCEFEGVKLVNEDSIPPEKRHRGEPGLTNTGDTNSLQKRWRARANL
jgi:hypothetical protein